MKMDDSIKREDSMERERDRSRRGDRPSRFSDATRDKSRDREERRRKDFKRLYVSNIPYEYRWQELKDLFREKVYNFVFSHCSGLLLKLSPILENGGYNCLLSI